MTFHMQFWVVVLVVLLMGGFGAMGCGESGSDSADTGSDADGDTDSDADSDTDSDADSDGDTGSDTDADSDTSSDSDSVSGGDADSDTDADTDTDADGDADTHGDADSETETNEDTDAERAAPWVDIIGVEMTGSEGRYNIMATFHSTDIDCTEYADWIEVLREDGTLVYRRILVHPHTPALTGNPVARGGGPVDVAADEVFIVRGHMNTVGYSGVPMRGSVNGGFEPAPDIGPDFAADVESEGEQPDGCTPEDTFFSG